MSNTQKIEELLKEIRQLEELVKEMQDAEMYPVSFFSRTFDLTHKILLDLHQIESLQIESLKKQMEEHQARLLSIPAVPSQPQPEPEEMLPPVKEKVEQIEVMPEITTEPVSTEPVFAEPMLTEPVVTEVKEERAEEMVETETEPVVELPVPVREKTEEKESVLSPKPGVCLSEVLEKKNLTDFRKAFSLNDRFYFLRELFGGQEATMNQAICDLNELHSLDSSLAYLTDKLEWDPENEHVVRFIQLLEKRFL